MKLPVLPAAPALLFPSCQLPAVTFTDALLIKVFVAAVKIAMYCVALIFCRSVLRERATT
jgi:hypothetical protein